MPSPPAATAADRPPTPERGRLRGRGPRRGAPLILEAEAGAAAYALLDSGGGRKLERVGPYRIDRPEPQAMWPRRLPAAEWAQADALFVGASEEEEGNWRFRRRLPETFPLEHEGLRFLGRFTAFRHLGYFPEQAPHWAFMRERLGRIAGRRPRLLNLFAYTGLASLVAAGAGAEVTHVDASKRAIQWARENQREAGFEGAPIRWILDDARKFAAREGRRGRQYDGILLDPPKFGRGPKGEVWKLFEDLPEMVRLCVDLLPRRGGFIILTAYAVRASHIALEELMAECLSGRGGRLEAGELTVREEGGGRRISTSLFARWADGDGNGR